MPLPGASSWKVLLDGGNRYRFWDSCRDRWHRYHRVFLDRFRLLFWNWGLNQCGTTPSNDGILRFSNGIFTVIRIGPVQFYTLDKNLKYIFYRWIFFQIQKNTVEYFFKYKKHRWIFSQVQRIPFNIFSSTKNTVQYFLKYKKYHSIFSQV